MKRQDERTEGKKCDVERYGEHKEKIEDTKSEKIFARYGRLLIEMELGRKERKKKRKHET